jgi:hypothetical protein
MPASSLPTFFVVVQNVDHRNVETSKFGCSSCLLRSYLYFFVEAQNVERQNVEYQIVVFEMWAL